MAEEAKKNEMLEFLRKNVGLAEEVLKPHVASLEKLYVVKPDMLVKRTVESFRGKLDDDFLDAISPLLQQDHSPGPTTIEEVISQRLPPLVLGTIHSAPSSTKSTTRHYPSLRSFDGFLDEARGFRVDPSTPLAVRRVSALVPDPEIVLEVVNEMEVHSAVARNIGRLLSSCGIFGQVASRKPLVKATPAIACFAPESCAAVSTSASSVLLSLAKKARRSCMVGDPDFGAWSQGMGGFTTVDVEPPWILQVMPDSSADIADSYRQGEGGQAENADANVYQEPSDNNVMKDTWRGVISREIGYMVDNEHMYGAITTYQKTWFLKAVNTDVFMISDAVLDTDPDVLRIWAYFLFKAKSSECSMRSLDVQGNQQGYISKRAKKQTSFHSEKEADRGSMLISKAIVPDIPNVSWGSIELLAELQQGRSGSVVLAQYEFQPVALKLFDVGKRGDSALTSELACYSAVQGAQGIAVPRVLFITQSPSGGVVGLGLELGFSLPSSFSEWCFCIRKQAYATLKLLAQKYGVAQNDLRPENFVLSSHHVLVVDLEDTLRLSGSEQTNSYLRRVRHSIGIKKDSLQTS